MKKAGELLTYYSKKGFLETLRRIRIRYFGIQSFILYKRDLRDDFKGISLEGDFHCKEGNLVVMREIRNDRKDLPREFYIDVTHSGKTFYIVYYKDEVAYIHWIFKNGEYSRFFDIQSEDTIEFNYNVTLPKFRGNKLQARSMNFICEDLKRKGYGSALGAVSSGNILSIKGMARTGFREMTTVTSYFSFVRKLKVQLSYPRHKEEIIATAFVTQQGALKEIEQSQNMLARGITTALIESGSNIFWQKELVLQKWWRAHFGRFLRDLLVRKKKRQVRLKVVY